MTEDKARQNLCSLRTTSHIVKVWDEKEYNGSSMRYIEALGECQDNGIRLMSKIISDGNSTQILQESRW